MKNITYKATLILIALAGYIGINIITPVLSDMASNFPDAGRTTMALVVTMPTITILAGLFLSATLSTRLRRKTLIVAGFSIVAVTGIAPYFLNSIMAILISRGILGVGMGLLMPLQASYFAEFDSITRSRLFGFNNVINGLLGAGMFMMISAFSLPWRNVFLLYTIFIAVLILMIIVLPKGVVLKAPEKTTTDASEPSGSLLQVGFIFSCIAAIFIMAAYLIIPTTLSFYLANHQLGGVREASNLSACGTIAIALCGCLYPTLRRLFGHQTASVSFVIVIIGFIFYAFPINSYMLWTGYLLTAIGPCIVTTDFSMQFTETLPTSKVATASAIFICCTFGGQFLSTYFQSTLIKLFPMITVESSYLVFACIMVVLMVLSFIIQHKTHSKRR